MTHKGKKGPSPPDPQGKQSDPRHQDLTCKAQHSQSITHGPSYKKHVFTLLIKYHICYRERASSKRDPLPERGFPAGFAMMGQPWLTQCLALPSPRMFQLTTGKSNPSKRSLGKKPKSRTARPSSPRSIRCFHRCAPDTINGNKPSLPGNLPLGNIHHAMENSQPELNILASKSYRIC